jgi:hypothetical protein
MKKFLLILLCAALVCSIAGCREDAPEVTVPTTKPVETTVPTQPVPTQPSTEPPIDFQAPLYAAMMPVEAQEFQAADGTVLLTYTAQELSVLLEDPQIADVVTLDFLNAVDYSSSPAPALLQSAREDYTGQAGWTPYAFSILYDAMRVDAGILSLYGKQVIQSDSLRPSSVPVSLTYDLLTGRRLALKDILQPAYSADTLVSAICDSLAGYADSGVLYSDYAYVISEMFSTNTPVKTWYFSPTGLCFYFLPYEVAPHSAGTIVAEIPYSALSGLLRDEYFPAEIPALSGNLHLAPLEDAALSQFQQFAELTLDRAAASWLLSTDGAAANVRIEVGIWSEHADAFYPTCTVFSAATLCEGDALLLQVSQEEIASMRITYESGGAVVSLPLNNILN